MKKTVLLIAITASVIACKKNDHGSDKQLLSTIDYTSDQKLNYIYDGSNRITASVVVNPTTSATLQQISYQPGSILIQPTKDSSADFNEIRYTVDTAGNPIQRTLSDILNFRGYGYGPQVTQNTSVINYHYDSNGLITGYDGTSTDSISYWPAAGNHFIQTEKYSFTAVFTMENENIKNITVNKSEVITKIESGVTSSINSTITESSDFFYDKGYPNKFDFNNTIVLKESDVLQFKPYIIQKKLKNYPNKMITTIGTDVTTEEAFLTFNRQGFISTAGQTPGIVHFLYRSL